MKEDPNRDKSDDGALVSKGIWVFFEILIGVIGGWFFWILIAKLSNPSEVGLATTVISFVATIVGFGGLGLDYVLLRQTSIEGKYVVGTLLVFKIAILSLLVPIAFYFGSNLYEDEFAVLLLLGIPLIFLSGISFIFRSSLQGMLKVKVLAGIMIAVVSSKIIIAGILLMSGMGATAIILGYFVSMLIGVIGMLLIVKKTGFAIASFKMFKGFIKLGLSNYVNTLTTILIYSLSIIFLAAVVKDPSEVGIFYITLMIMLIVSSLGGALAIVALPASSIKDRDASGTSLKLGLFMSLPFVPLLVFAPSDILSIISQDYVAGSTALIVLGFVILPEILVANCITKLNYQKDLRHMIILGSIRATFFIIPFFLLTVEYSLVGAAFAILISSIASATYCLYLMKTFRKMFAISIIILGVGLFSGILIQTISPIAAGIFSVTVCLFLIFFFKQLTIKEILLILKTGLKG